MYVLSVPVPVRPLPLVLLYLPLFDVSFLFSCCKVWCCHYYEEESVIIYLRLMIWQIQSTLLLSHKTPSISGGNKSKIQADDTILHGASTTVVFHRTKKMLVGVCYSICLPSEAILFLTWPWRTTSQRNTLFKIIYFFCIYVTIILSFLCVCVKCVLCE